MLQTRLFWVIGFLPDSLACGGAESARRATTGNCFLPSPGLRRLSLLRLLGFSTRTSNTRVPVTTDFHAVIRTESSRLLQRKTTAHFASQIRTRSRTQPPVASSTVTREFDVRLEQFARLFNPLNHSLLARIMQNELRGSRP